ncbi:hypothetical protein D3C79_743090 [compost metagenome]
MVTQAMDEACSAMPRRASRRTSATLGVPSSSASHTGDPSWRAPPPSSCTATSASSPMLTPARPPPPNASCSTPGSTTRWARCTMVPRPWTGWPRSRSAASPSPRRRPQRSGKARPSSSPTSTVSTSSTPQATSISPSRWSAHCACSMARSWYSAARTASSRSPRQSGARPTSTTCHAWPTSTRWTAKGPTSCAWSSRSINAWGTTRCPSSWPSAAKRTSSARSTW